MVLMLCAAFLAGGCATPAVWGIKDCKPSANGNVSLAFAPQKHDFLVKYDELRGYIDKTPHSNSYWLFAYSDNPPKNCRPSSVQETDVSELVTIPVLKWNAPVPETGYSAIYFPMQGTFDLYHNGVDLGRFSLPTYSTERKPANFSRVILTPPAVIADTAIAGCILGFFAVANSGGNVPHF